MPALGIQRTLSSMLKMSAQEPKPDVARSRLYVSRSRSLPLASHHAVVS